MLRHSQIDALFVCLGLDYGNIRGACLLARKKSNGVELHLEILRWHCTNSDGDLLRLIQFAALGRIPIRCRHCHVLGRTRQMFRFPEYSFPEFRRSLCCNCVLAETRFFLSGRPCLISEAGLDHNDRRKCLAALTGRTKKRGIGDPGGPRKKIPRKK